MVQPHVMRTLASVHANSMSRDSSVINALMVRRVSAAVILMAALLAPATQPDQSQAVPAIPVQGGVHVDQESLEMVVMCVSISITVSLPPVVSLVSVLV